jgi:aryl-alcohol dehydrogenase-like predicted oxidoreductase
VALAQSAATARHFLGLISEQSHYSLAVRSVEFELIPALHHLGIGLIPYSPLRIGLLAGALEKVTKGLRRFRDFARNRWPLRGSWVDVAGSPTVGGWRRMRSPSGTGTC